MEPLEGSQWEEFTRVVVARWTAGDSVSALAALERVGRGRVDDPGDDGWWERGVSASSLGGPLRAAWFMIALAIVGDELSVGDARVGFALNRARTEAASAGVTLRSLSDDFVRTSPLRVDALASLLLRRARALAASPPPYPTFDVTGQVLELFAEAIGSALRAAPRPVAEPPRAPPEPIVRTAGTPAQTTVLPRVDPSSQPLFSTANAGFAAADDEALATVDFRALARRWLAPIEGDAPAGVDATYDERMQRVVERVNQLESAASNDSQSRLWSDVARVADELLVDVTKDLTLASYFAHAMIHLEGPTGLARGLALLVGLLEDHWAAMYPPAARLKRRANALAWYCERSVIVINSKTARRADASALTASKALLDRFERLTRERLDDAAPNFTPLREAIALRIEDAAL